MKKNIFTAIILGIALASVSFAQGARSSAGVKTAVVEFTPGPNAPGMTAEAKRHLQASIAASLNNTRRFDVYDVRHTRTASQPDLASVNGTSTAAAVRVGKQLGVNYVVTGTVVEYNTKGTGTIKFRVVEVATGKVKYSGEVSEQATMKMTGNAAAAEMQAKVLKPMVQKLTAALLAEF
ncbi:MAG: hypothetical protein ABL984_18945 [Pyrinomonadaceae bacterium]